MKGFFSARGQGMRSNGAVNAQFGDKPGANAQQATASHDLTGKGSSAMHSQRGNQLANS